MEDNVSTMASDPVAAYSVTSYNDVMDYMHSIHISREDKEKVAKRLTIEVSQPALAEAYERIDHLSTLPKDWDGHGALPISYKVLRNIKQVLMLSQNSDWEHWVIAPDTNATLCIESEATGAVISLGAYEYSYFVKIDGVRYGDSHIDFDPESFLELMRRLMLR
jgi:hypothetical protein